MDATRKMQALILAKYKSIRQFSVVSGIPYSTIRSGLEKGIGGMAVETVLKMCKVVGIAVEELDDEPSKSSPTNVTLAAHRTDGYDTDLPPEALEELEHLLGYLRSKYRKKGTDDPSRGT